MDPSKRSVEDRLTQLEREVKELRWVLARQVATGQAGAEGAEAAARPVGGPGPGSARVGGAAGPGGATMGGSATQGAETAGAAGPSGAGSATGGPRATAYRQSPRIPRFDASAVLGDPESWLAKGGIGLVGLGVLLLFKYAVDQGWITPALRCVIGLVVGLALYVVAHRVRHRHPIWSQIVVGGGLGVLYLTIWASSVLYELVPVMLAFAGLALVSGEMVRRGAGVSRASLAVIGTIFGFAAPLLLSDVGRTAPLVVLAYAVVLAGAAVLVFARRGWLLLVLVTAAGAFLLLAQMGDPAPAQRLELQVSLVVLWLLVAIAPLVVAPPDGRVIGLGIPADETMRRVARSGALRLAVLGATVAALARTASTWDIGSNEAVGALIVLPAALFSATAWFTRERDQQAFQAALEVATLLLLAAAGIALRNGWLLASEASILTAAMWVGSITSAIGLTWIAHFGFLGLAIGMSSLFTIDVTANRALGALIAIMSVVPAARWNAHQIARVYQLAGYAFFLFWLLWVLEPLPQGALIGSAVWGVIGTGIVVSGATRDRLSFERVGLATLAATAGKMLLYDLAEAATLWRIALFIGFGTVLLGVGYYLRERRARGETA